MQKFLARYRQCMILFRCWRKMMDSTFNLIYSYSTYKIYRTIFFDCAKKIKNMWYLFYYFFSRNFYHTYRTLNSYVNGSIINWIMILYRYATMLVSDLSLKKFFLIFVFHKLVLLNAYEFNICFNIKKYVRYISIKWWI